MSLIEFFVNTSQSIGLFELVDPRYDTKGVGVNRWSRELYGHLSLSHRRSNQPLSLLEYDLYEFNYLDLSFSGSNAGATTDITTLRRVGDVLHASAEKWIGTRLA